MKLAPTAPHDTTGIVEIFRIGRYAPILLKNSME